MKKENNEEILEALNRISICLYVLIAMVFVLLIVVIIKNTDSTPKVQGNNESSSEQVGYDTTQYQSATIDEVLEMFNNKETKVLYFGRQGCGACQMFSPILTEVQDELGFKAVYIDIDDVDEKSDAFEKVMDKLNKKYTMNVNGTDQTKTFAEFYGFTPTTIVISNGKMVDGIIGAASADGLKDFLKEAGIK